MKVSYIIKTVDGNAVRSDRTEAELDDGVDIHEIIKEAMGSFLNPERIWVSFKIGTHTQYFSPRNIISITPIID